MKKLTLLVALLLCVTIGGVYATWIFAGDTILPQTDPFTNKMDDVDTETSAGSYHFVNNSIAIVVEPNNNTDHMTQIRWEGSVTLQFRANTTISDAPLAKALSAAITIEAVDIASATYDDGEGAGARQIYTLNDTFVIQLDESKWTPDASDEYLYTYTINAADLAGAVTMDSFHLQNYDAYKAFKTAQDVVKFKFRVKPGT